MEPVVSLRSAVSLLGRFPALAGVDLDVARGEIVLLQGPNGAGKSTLLRTLAGLLRVVSGTAFVLGHDLRTDARSVRPRVGLLGHATMLYDELTVGDNVRFWARAAHASTDDADAALAALGLDGRLRDVAVSRLSTGQRRRASIATMVARRPELWLLDEPHAGLDASARTALNALLGDASSSGITVVIASHETEFVDSLATRAVTITGGRVTGERSTGEPASQGGSPGGPVAAPPAGPTNAQVAHVA
ncbi:MAG TPA: heme ABC exporter ATP-binding protein CcmA [Acidimicrobiales bacterium]